MNKVSRRGFLGAPAILASPANLEAQEQGEPLRIAVVGVGNRGSFLLRHVVRIPGVRVVAVCDLMQERAEAAAAVVAGAGGNARVWTDFRKMLDQQKEIDAVVVATPDSTHKDIDIAVLEVGKHLYAEKPLALTPADCGAIVKAVRQAKGIMQVGLQLRHDPARNAAMQHIHSGGIGKVLMCHGMRHGGDLPRDIPWYFNRENCGDIVVDQGIHILDLFSWAIGTHPLRAIGSGGTNLFIDDPPGRTVMDNYNLILEYPGGVRVNFSHHYFDPPGFTGIQERVFGSEGAIDLIKATWKPRARKADPVTLEVPSAGEDSTYMSLAAFADNIRKGNRRPLNNVESAMESTLMVLMGTRAIHQRRAVTWDEIAKETGI